MKKTYCGKCGGLTNKNAVWFNKLLVYKKNRNKVKNIEVSKIKQWCD